MIERTENTTVTEWGGVFGGAGYARTYTKPLLAFDLFQWSHDYN